MNKITTVDILQIPVTTSPESDILEFIFTRLHNSKEKTFITTPNPEMVMHAYYNKEYQKVLRSADISLPDGVGLLWAAGVLGKPLQGRITGVDFMQKLCREASTPTKSGSKRQLTVGFLGGRGNVATRAAECLKKSYPDLTIGFVGEEWDNRQSRGISKFEFLNSNNNKKTDTNNLQSATRQMPYLDILFVAYGVPKQEEWIYKNLPNIKVRCAVGVGGAFDYIAGDVKRAPKWMRKIGLEWLYRLARQPWRWRRQVALVKFVIIVLLVRLGLG